jgi:hypothetical protein
MIWRLVMLAGLGIALGACAGGGGAPAPARPTAPPTRSSIVVVPQVMAPQGLDGVIGSSAERLTRRFGDPRINLAEGDARKLQFAGQGCVLDVYLYPVNAGAAPTATHVEARLRQGGAAVDAGACIREVEER